MLSVLASLLCTVVLAQDDGIDIELFHPNADFYGYAASPGAATLQNLQLGGGLWFDYESNPVVLVDTDGNRVSLDDGDTEALVASRANLHALVGMGFTRFGSLTVDVPFVLAQNGYETPVMGDPTASKLPVAGVGDIVLAPKVALVDRDRAPVGLAFAVPVSLPSGDAAAFLGEGAVSVAPQATFEWSNGRIHTRAYTFRVAGTAGALLREPSRLQDTLLGNGFLYALGAGLHVISPVEFTVDFHGNRSGDKGAQNPAELLVGGKALIGQFFAINAGAGAGLFGGVGAPDLRVYAGLAFAPSLDPANRDTDGDKIPDGQDKCPKDAEDMDGFQDEDGCPDLDNDADGREDAIDKCPNDPEDDDGFMDNDGCPDPDNDNDGILDVDDRCPNEFGVAELGGCPNRDTDGDGIPDELDRCPYDAEDFDGDRDEDGCPDENQRVVVEKNFIRINDVIYFDFNKVTIQERSYDLLDEVAKVVNANPQILKIRIEGHTDNVGSDLANLKLSQGRAESVKTYLQTRGVDASRLDAAGFGKMRPIATNDTDEGRSQNRRVEFIIVDQR